MNYAISRIGKTPEFSVGSRCRVSLANRTSRPGKRVAQKRRVTMSNRHVERVPRHALPQMRRISSQSAITMGLGMNLEKTRVTQL